MTLGFIEGAWPGALGGSAVGPEGTVLGGITTGVAGAGVGLVGATMAFDALESSNESSVNNPNSSPETPGGVATTEKTLDRALTQDKLQKVFGQEKHNLSGLVRQFGGREGAMRQIVQSLGKVKPDAGGFFKEIRNVGGTNVTVTGRVVEGSPLVSNAWVP